MKEYSGNVVGGRGGGEREAKRGINFEGGKSEAIYNINLSRLEGERGERGGGERGREGRKEKNGEDVAIFPLFYK